MMRIRRSKSNKKGGKWGIIKEAKNALGGETTSHNCYGVGDKGCKEAGLLENGQPMNWKPVYRPKTPNSSIDKSIAINEVTEMD